jgi:uncharacterized repeat protein (TIGR04076 family)
MKEVKVTVVSQRGHCAHGHKVGDTWMCGTKTPAGMCASAYHALYPIKAALAAGGSFDWANPDGSVEVACPDHLNPVVMRLKPVE